MRKLKKSLQIGLGILLFTFTVGLISPAVLVYADISENTTQVVDECYVKTSGQRYTYCPVGIKTNEKETAFYCKNGVNGQIVDYIYATTRTKNGKTRTNVALSPSTDGFDSIHVCDPSVVSDSYSYNGNTYKYAMFYLGAETLDNQCNQIGIALSNHINSRFLKPENNIVIGYTYDSNHPEVFQWGVGQPSAISLGNGKVLLFYTKGDMNGTDTYVSLLDMSSVNSIQNLGTTKVSTEGVESFISNADFAYNNVSQTLYMICDKRPFADGLLNIVADTSCVYSTFVSLDDINALSTCKWILEKNIDSTVTGHERNHNCGFLRDEKGYVNGMPEILCTVADTSLWEYRIELLK